MSAVWAYDLAAVGLFAYIVAAWRRGSIVLKRDALSIALLVAAGALLVWYAALTGYRITARQSVSGNFLTTRVLLFSLLAFFAMKSETVSAPAASLGLLAWVTLLNALQLISLFALGVAPRYSLVLANINVYNAFVTMTVPLAAYAWSESGHYGKPFRSAVRWALGLNYIVAMHIVIMSGSRSAFILYAAVSLGSLFIVRRKKFSAARAVKLAAVPLALAAWFAALLFMNVSPASEGIYRSLYYPIQAAGKVLNAPQWKDPEWLKPSGPAEDGENPTVGETVELSDDVRGMIQREAVSEIAANPLTGTGRPDVFIGERGYQSAHNFLLEYALSYGIPGAALCVAVILLPLYFILFRYRLPAKVKITALCLYAVTLAFSSFQPLITTKYSIAAVLWMTTAMLARLRTADPLGGRRQLG